MVAQTYDGASVMRGRIEGVHVKVKQVYENKVIAEVSEAPFIAVIADETTDVSVQNQLTLVIRYIHNCKVVERFWGFFKPDRVNADGIANVILEELEKILKGD